MFKSIDEITKADPRFAHFRVLEGAGHRAMQVEDHYRAVFSIQLENVTPTDVVLVFDRARHAFIYAWFSYDLFVVSESQAYAAVELALRLKVKGSARGKSDGLRSLIQQARKMGFVPPPVGRIDPLDALAMMRNELAHGSTDFHTPAMTLQVLSACADAINHLQR
jgi:hypothetical protein